MKASPSEALPKASIPSLGAFLTQGTNPALAARSFLQTGREALAEVSRAWTWQANVDRMVEAWEQRVAG